MVEDRAASRLSPWRRARAALLGLACALGACAFDGRTAAKAETPGIALRQVTVLDEGEPPRFRLIHRLAWSPDGARIAAFGLLEGRYDLLTGGPYAAALWDAASGRRIALLPHPGPGPGTHGLQIGFTRDGRTFVLPAGDSPGAPGAADNPLLRDQLLLVDAATGRPTGAVPSGLPEPPPAAQPQYLAVSPTADRAVAAFGAGLAGGNRVVAYEIGPDGSWRAQPFFVVPPSRVTGFAFAPSGPPRLGVLRFVPSGLRDGLSRVLAEVRAPDGAPVWSVPAEMRHAGQSFAWGDGSGGGRLFVGGGGTGGDGGGPEGDRVVALEASSGALLWKARWHAGYPVNALAASPDGTLLAAASNGLRVLRATDGATLAWLPNLDVTWSVAWSPDGTRVAANDAGKILIFRVEAD
jgi:hypothetical protein